MSEPENHTLALLREMRADLERRHDAVTAEFAAIRRQLETMNANGVKALRSFVGHRTMVERTIASFDSDISELRRRVDALEAAQP
jgi:vacuolar-type H+-ATPase subunit D/Vma8